MIPLKVILENYDLDSCMTKGEYVLEIPYFYGFDFEGNHYVWDKDNVENICETTLLYKVTNYDQENLTGEAELVEDESLVDKLKLYKHKEDENLALMGRISELIIPTTELEIFNGF